MSSTKDRPDAWVQLPDAQSLAPLFENHPYNFGFVAAMGRLIAAHDSIDYRTGMQFFFNSIRQRIERHLIEVLADQTLNVFVNLLAEREFVGSGDYDTFDDVARIYVDHGGDLGGSQAAGADQ